MDADYQKKRIEIAIMQLSALLCRKQSHRIGNVASSSCFEEEYSGAPPTLLSTQQESGSIRSLCDVRTDGKYSSSSRIMIYIPCIPDSAFNKHLYFFLLYTTTVSTNISQYFSLLPQNYPQPQTIAIKRVYLYFYRCRILF